MPALMINHMVNYFGIFNIKIEVCWSTVLLNWERKNKQAFLPKAIRWTERDLNPCSK